MSTLSSISLALLAFVSISSTMSAQATLARRSPEEATADSLYSAKNYASAFDAYSALVRRDSSVGRDWYQLGMTAALTARYGPGATAFERAAQLTKNPAAMYNAGAMHARLGHKDVAFTWLDRAVNAGFANSQLLQTDDDLALVRDDPRFAKLLYAASHAATPCASEALRHQFDFFIGEWTTTTKEGAPVGGSVIESVSGGCAVLENWTAGNGSTGKSLNAYNPLVHQWQQYWVGQGGGVTEYRSGELDGTSMVFHTKDETNPNNLGRLTFTPLDNVTVRQHAESSSDGGKTWTTSYDFYYHRKAH